jgi:hypothetical protein
LALRSVSLFEGDPGSDGFFAHKSIALEYVSAMAA